MTLIYIINTDIAHMLTILGSLLLLTPFVFVITLYNMHNSYYHFIDEKIEIQRGCII